MLVAFFHTREAGPDAPYYRYHITGNDTLEMHALNVKPGTRKERSSARNFALQRVFNNRQYRESFSRLWINQVFLSRDNVREVTVVR